MIVFERDGKEVVVTGWRAWLIGAVALIGAMVVLGAVAFLLLGIAASLVAFLAILVPAIAIVAVVAWLFQPRKP